MPFRILLAVAIISRTFLGVVALTGCLAVPAFAQNGSEVPHRRLDDNAVVIGSAVTYPKNNILQRASKSSDLTTFAAAIKAANLSDTLEDNGPLTVFAPTNAAFSKLPGGMVASWLKPENTAMLAQILTYQIVAGRLEDADLTDGKKLLTVQGEELTVKCADDGKIMIVDGNDDVAILTASYSHQSNGVIHAVDAVLMPKAWAYLLQRK
jgi:uncharacterized surface protein with fasciclin (FAS1) repeats